MCAELPTDAHERGREFERLCARVLPQIDREVVSSHLWHEWPGRDGEDIGIDIVGVRRDGTHVAVQCKAYARERSISKSDIDSFVSASGDPRFAARYLLSTSDGLARHARRTLGSQVIPSRFFGATRLRELQLDWSSAEVGPPPVQRMRPHQRDAVNAVTDKFGSNTRVRLEMACGTGKTLVGVRLAERLQSNVTVVVAPSLALLSDLIDVWSAQYGARLPRLAVCSDESVGATSEEWVGNLHAGATTDPAAVAAFLAANDRALLFSTYRSLPQLVEGLTAAGRRADLTIADEAHRAVGLLGSSTTQILADSFPSARRLFMTATPRNIAEPEDWSELERARLASMDDIALFGPLAYTLTFGDAIARGLLCDFQLHISVIHEPEVEALIAQRRLVTPSPDQVLDAESLALQVAAARLIAENGLSSVLAYFNRVPAAREFARQLPDTAAWLADDANLPIPAGESISGTDSAVIRGAALGRLAAGSPAAPRVLASVDTITEGVDVPAVDGIVIGAPRSSRADIFQMIGRALRRSDDPNKTAHILVAVFVPADQAETAPFDDERYDALWKVVAALGLHDQRLADEIDALRLGLGPHRVRQELPERIRLDAPESVSLDFAAALETALVRRVGETPQSQRRRRTRDAGPDESTSLVRREPLSRELRAALLDGLENEGHVGATNLATLATTPNGRLLARMLAEIELRAGGEPFDYFSQKRDRERFEAHFVYGDLPRGAFPLLERRLSPFCDAYDLAHAQDSGDLARLLRRIPAIRAEDVALLQSNAERYYDLVIQMCRTRTAADPHRERGYFPADEEFARSAAGLFASIEHEAADYDQQHRREFLRGAEAGFDPGSTVQLFGIPPTVTATFERGYEWVTDWVDEAAARVWRSRITRVVDDLNAGVSEDDYLKAVFAVVDSLVYDDPSASLPLAS